MTSFDANFMVVSIPGLLGGPVRDVLKRFACIKAEANWQLSFRKAAFPQLPYLPQTNLLDSAKFHTEARIIPAAAEG